MIVCLDFLFVYIFTHKVEVALGFMVVSNVYTTVGYFLHERLWARIQWGREPAKEPSPHGRPRRFSATGEIDAGATRSTEEGWERPQSSSTCSRW